MLNLLRVATSLLFFLTLAAAFPLTHLLDSDLGSAGRQGFIVTGSSGETSPTELRDELVRYTEDHQITVGLEQVRATREGTTRSLHVAAGEDSSTMSTWLRTGYSGFDPSVSVSVSPLSEAALTDAGGLYHVAGAQRQVQDLQRHVESLGFNTTPIQLNLFYFLGNPVSITVIAALLLIATITLGGVLLRARDYAIQRIHGHGFWTIVSHDLRELFPTALLSFAVCSVLSALALYLYNGFHAAGLYARYAAALLAVGSAVLLLSLFIGIAALHLVSLLPALKGKIPGVLVSSGIYVLRFIAVATALITVGSVVSTALELQFQRSQHDLWRTHGDAVAFQISTRTGDTNGDIAPALRAADERNELLLSISSEDLSRNPSTLIVNSLFAEQELSLPPNESPQPGEALILIPAGAPADYIAAARERILLEANLAKVPAPTITEKLIPGDTEVFTYASSFGLNSPQVTVSGVPILVLPRGLETLSDRNLVAPATQLQVFAVNEAAMRKLVADPQAGPYIAGYSTALSHWEQTHVKAQTQLRVQTFNLAILVLVVTAYVLGSAAVYQTRHRQRLTVTDLMGGAPWRARLGLLVIEAVFLIIPVAWLLARQRDYDIAALTGTPRHILRSMAVTPELVAATIGIAAAWALTCLAMSAHLGRIYSRTPAR